MATVALSPSYRADALRAVGDREVDVLVIGGGITGAGTALDAAARGLSVVLVEARDLASGTSSRSSKLIHGGLRYLEQRNFALVREALKERALLLNRLAPHLVRPVQFLLPLRHRVWERAYIGAGVTLYDLLGGARALPRHRQLGHAAALREAPGLRPDALIGAIQYYDAQVDDARHTMMVARTAAEHGATVLPRTKATRLLTEDDRVIGLRAHDTHGGTEFDIRARRVISATGVWTDDILAESGGPPPFKVQTSKGVHLLVPRHKIPFNTGLISRTEKSVLFVIPWGRHWIIGTTDTPWELDRAHPAVSGADVDYLLDHVNALLREPLTRDDIDGVSAGLRPLLAGASSETAQLSREHAVAEPVPGLFVIAGGKYTTYRVMAKDVVDAATSEFGRPVEASRTDRLPILGGEGFQELWAGRERLASRHGLQESRIEHLLRRYGSCIGELLDLMEQRGELAEPIPGAPGYLRAEAVYAASHEGALHLEDVLTRRTRISIEENDRGTAAAPEIARLIAPVLSWNEADVQREIDHYAARLQAENAAQEAPDDASADAIRRTVGDPASAAAAEEEEGGRPVGGRQGQP